MKRQILSFLVMMALSPMVIAQSTITGKIVDESNNQSVPFVNVGMFRVSDTAFVSGAASDDKGAFTLQAVPKGEMLLKISAIGYELFEMPVTVKGDQNLGTLKLKAGTTRLDEVVITEKRPMFAVEGEKTLYNVAEDPSIQTGTASDALQNAPGVEVDVEGNITLRGTSSVEVWINDKPSHLTSENLKTYIQTLPANSIDHVEVITNPSARYGSKADGIINIVTNAKVQKNEFVSFGVTGSTRPSVAPWVSYVWSNEKLTFNAYINGGYSVWEGSRASDQSLYNASGVLANHEVDSMSYYSRSYNTGGHFSLDYEIDTANSLNVWFSAWPNWNNNESGTTALREEYLDADGLAYVAPLTVDYRTEAQSKESSSFMNGGLYYQHKFDDKGHNLSVSGNMMGWADKGGSRSDRHFVLPVDHLRAVKSTESSSYVGGEMEMVYNRPYSENGEVSVGYTLGYRPDKQALRTDTLVGETWVNDAYRTYDATFANLNNEAFITVQHKFGGFTVKPGLRFVSELVTGAYADSSQYDFRKHFPSLRPSLHLSYRTKSMHNFRASYTMRITAPTADQLSPFPLYSEDSYTTGNPDLDRIFTHSVEAGWTKYWNNFGSVGLSAFYRGKTNEVNFIRLSQYHWLYDRVVLYSYPVNVGSSYIAGLDYNMMYRPNGFFNVRFYGNLYKSHLETVFNGVEYKPDDMWSCSVRMNLWAKLWNKLEVTAAGYYSSPTQSLFSERHARYGFDAGMRADFFNRKMSVFVNASDIFNTNSWGMSNSSPYVVSTMNSKFSSRFVSVGLTFRFGKMELEQKARQGADDSQGAPQGMGN